MEPTPTTAEAEMLAAIHARPEDTAARLVYGDWLVERGDPRGELIVLQCREPKSNTLAYNRVAELLRLHARRWLKPIAPILVGRPRFARGFLDGVRVRNRHAQYAALAEDPLFATVDEVWFDEVRAQRLPGAARAVTRLGGVSSETLVTLLQTPSDISDVTLIGLPSRPLMQPIVTAPPTLVRWRRVACEAFAPVSLSWWWKTMAAARIDEIELARGLYALRHWVASRAQLPEGVARLTLRLANHSGDDPLLPRRRALRFSFTRDTRAALTRLEVTLGRPPYTAFPVEHALANPGPSMVAALIAQLPTDACTRINVFLGPEASPLDVRERYELRAACERQRQLAELVLPP